MSLKARTFETTAAKLSNQKYTKGHTTRKEHTKTYLFELQRLRRRSSGPELCEIWRPSITAYIAVMCCQGTAINASKFRRLDPNLVSISLMDPRSKRCFEHQLKRCKCTCADMAHFSPIYLIVLKSYYCRQKQEPIGGVEKKLFYIFEWRLYL